MIEFNTAKGSGIILTIFMILTIDILVLLVLSTNIFTSYEFITFSKLALVAFNVYQLYYVLQFYTIKYIFDEEFIISSLFGLKKVKIKYDDIKGYCYKKGNLNGVTLSGHLTNKFAIGKAVLEKIGTATMYVTNSRNIFYIKTGDRVFALSPLDYIKFQEELQNRNLQEIYWEKSINKNIRLYKDKKFKIPFMLVTIVIIIQTALPLILFIKGALPDKMPLSFNAKFQPMKIGTDRQFAFKQAVYGVINMAILFCLYYVSYFYARYDKRLSYKYMYIALGVALTFLFLQIKILFVFA